jgi:hypothetical protein
MSEQPIPEPERAAPGAAVSGGRPDPDDLAAIIDRAARMGIAAWRVTTALGLSAAPLDPRSH